MELFAELVGRQYAAVFWDYGDTLENHAGVDWAALMRRFVTSLGTAYQAQTGVTLDLQQMCSQYGAVNEALERRAAQTGAETPAVEVARQLLPDSGARLSGEQLDDLVLDRYLREAPLPLFSDVADTLGQIAEWGLPQVVVSNAVWNGCCLRRNLARQGILKYFQAVISSADIGLRKPRREIFEAALQAVPIPPEKVLFVGDNPGADVVGARQMGMTAVWKRNGPALALEQPVPDVEILHAAEVLTLIRPDQT